MVRNSLGRREGLAEEDKRLLEDITVVQWQRRMPWDVPPWLHSPLPSMPDWLARAAANPAAFTAYVGPVLLKLS